MRRHAINRAAHLLTAVGIALVAVVGLVALSPTDASAGFNVFDFTCTGNTGSVSVDVRGLGNTNVCIAGSFSVDADCACVNNGGNCPSDTHKQTETTTLSGGVSVEPKNGRVNTTVDLSSFISAGACTALQSSCGSGQTARAITETVDANYTLCTTTAAGGTACSCGGAGQTTLATAGGGTCDTSQVSFAGKKNSCINLFP